VRSSQSRKVTRNICRTEDKHMLGVQADTRRQTKPKGQRAGTEGSMPRFMQLGRKKARGTDRNNRTQMGNTREPMATTRYPLDRRSLTSRKNAGAWGKGGTLGRVLRGGGHDPESRRFLRAASTIEVPVRGKESPRDKGKSCIPIGHGSSASPT